MNRPDHRNTFRITVYDLPENSSISCPEQADRVYFAYCSQGKCQTDSSDAGFIYEDDGKFVGGTLTTQSDSLIWLFEVAPAAAPFLDLDIIESSQTEITLENPLLIRADRVESTHGAQTPMHGHRGPGMRRLIKGLLRADVGENVKRIRAGDSWFESGKEPVVGTNYGGGNAAFVRILLLPLELEGGQSSFMAWNADEAAKPRSVNLRIFGEKVMGR